MFQACLSLWMTLLADLVFLSLLIYYSDLERRAPNTCAVSFPWRMMYGEHRFLKPSGTQFGLEWYIHFRILNQPLLSLMRSRTVT